MASGLAITVRDQTSTGREVGEQILQGVASPTTLRDIIVTRVREEVAAFNSASHPRFRGLVAPEGAAHVAHGEWDVPANRTVDWEAQARTAVEAFERGAFLVIVGDRQVTDLDVPVELDAGSVIRFVRLVALVGG